METDGGGWTMFSNYDWNRGQNPAIERAAGPPLKYFGANSDFQPSEEKFTLG